MNNWHALTRSKRGYKLQWVVGRGVGWLVAVIGGRGWMPGINGKRLILRPQLSQRGQRNNAFKPGLKPWLSEVKRIQGLLRIPESTSRIPSSPDEGLATVASRESRTHINYLKLIHNIFYFHLTKAQMASNQFNGWAAFSLDSRFWILRVRVRGLDSAVATSHKSHNTCSCARKTYRQRCDKR